MQNPANPEHTCNAKQWKQTRNRAKQQTHKTEKRIIAEKKMRWHHIHIDKGSCKRWRMDRAAPRGMEVDLNFLKKMSAEYAEAKNVAIKEIGILDVQNIKHISEDKELIGDVVEKVADDWHVQKQTFYKQTGLGEDEVYGQELEQLLLLQQYPDDEEYNQMEDTSEL